MRNLAIVLVVALITIYLLTSGDPEPAGEPAGPTSSEAGALGALETFTWDGQQPISFRPPAGWRSGRFQQGGRNGVMYSDAGQSLTVTEYTRVGALDGCANLQDVLARFGVADNDQLQRDLRRAVRSPRSVSDPAQAEMLSNIGAYVESAGQALERGDLAAARQEIDYALRARFTYRLRLDDFLDDVLFDREPGGDLKRVAIDLPRRITVGGEEAVSVDYEMDIDAQFATGRLQKTEVGRELYVMHDNRLFIAGFQGKPENMALFESLTESISFPDGPCSL